MLALDGPKGTGLPGGRLEAGETAVVAAMRELKEETGLAVKPGVSMGCLQSRITDNGVMSHGFWLYYRDTVGRITDSREGRPFWSRPEDLVRARPGRPPVRFPVYNAWALQQLGLQVSEKACQNNM